MELISNIGIYNKIEYIDNSQNKNRAVSVLYPTKSKPNFPTPQTWDERGNETFSFSQKREEKKGGQLESVVSTDRFPVTLWTIFLFFSTPSRRLLPC